MLKINIYLKIYIYYLFVIEILSSDPTIIQKQPCDVFPCKNGGTCRNNLNSYTCTCNAGFSGIDCQIQSPSISIYF